MKYKLELTDVQLKVVRDALEVYARLGVCNLDSAMEQMGIAPEFSGRVRTIQKELEAMRYGPSQLNPRPGIASTKVPERFKTAWDLYQVARHRLAWDQHVVGDSILDVQFDPPMRTAKEHIAKLEPADKRASRTRRKKPI